jgi:hypothetical protein
MMLCAASNAKGSRRSRMFASFPEFAACISRSFYVRFYAAAIRTLHDQQQGHG